MGLSFQDVVSAGQKAVSVLSNPRQSSVAAAGLAGVFSAEVNNLRQNALSYLPGITAKLGPSYQSVVDSLLRPVKNVLGGDPSNPIPSTPSGTIAGLSYLNVMLIAGGLALISIFMIGRGSK